MTPEAFESTLFQLLDGGISQENFTELERYLEESAEARRQFLEYVDLHNVLDLKLASGGHAQPGISKVIPVERVLKRQNLRSMRVALLAAAAAFVALAVTLKFILAPESKPLLSFQLAPGSNFAVTHDSTLEEEPKAGTLVEGSRLLLTRGTVELTLASGVVSIVQAPADLTLHTKDRLHLQQGIGWFYVPKSGHGFQVQTPDLVVTDLGTEFGVVSDLSKLDEVHLFKGKVEVRNRHALKKTELLSGKTARIAGPVGRFKEIAVHPGRFLTSLPTEPHSTPPYLHFAFDAIDGNLLKVEGSHPDVSSITARFVPGGGRQLSEGLVPGINGQALRFNGQGDHVETNWPGINDHQARTVALWVRIPEGVDFTELPAILGWGDDTGKYSKWKLQVTHESAERTPVVRLTFGYQWFNGKTRLDDGEWHHLTAIYHGKVSEEDLPVVSVYVDGELEPLTHATPPKSNSGFPDTFDPELSMPMIMGKGLREQTNTFRGEMDELHIYQGVLPEEAIKELARPSPAKR